MTDCSDLLAKVRELKVNQNKFKKEKRLITNMKLLVKDSNQLTAATATAQAKPQQQVITSPTHFATIDPGARK